MDRTEMWVVESLKQMQCRISRYANGIEGIPECSVCFERLGGPMSVCAQGHYICIKCEPQISKCPICKSDFNGTENQLSESVSSKMKISVSDSENSCIGSEASDMVKKNANEESPPSPIANQSKQLSVEETGPCIEGKGKFPCRIGNCTDEMTYCRMINHIKYLHEEFLIEVGSVHGYEYNNTWRILYKINDTFDKAIYIYNMGIFFLKIVINEEGNLHGCVQMTNSQLNAKYFQYKLLVGNQNTFACFEGKVLASRVASNKNRKGLTIHHSYLNYLLQRKKSYECILKISLIPHSQSPTKLKLKRKRRNSRESL